MPRKDGTLTKKEKDFCEAYVECGSATHAYLIAYNCEYTTANAQGFRKLRQPAIREYVATLQKQAFEGACITAERVALKLADIAFAPKNDETYNASAQLKALDLLQKQLGLQHQKVEAEVSTDIVINIGE